MAFEAKDPRPLPPPNVPMIDPQTGRVTPEWYPYLTDLDRALRAVLKRLRTL